MFLTRSSDPRDPTKHIGDYDYYSASGRFELEQADESLLSGGSLVQEPNETQKPAQQLNSARSSFLFNRSLFSPETNPRTTVPPIRRKRRTKKTGVTVPSFVSALAWLGCFLFICVAMTALQGASFEDVQEIDTMIQKLSYDKLEEKDRLLDIKASIQEGNAPAHRVLVVGMVESLSQLQQNFLVIRSIAGLCWLYENAGRVDVRILYKANKMKEPLVSDEDRADMLKARLMQGGCSVSLEPEDVLWQSLEMGEEERQKSMVGIGSLSRYERLARLRSSHRSQILGNLSSDFDIVLTVDLDVVGFPPMPTILNSIERIVSESRSGVGNIVCANGIETWNLGGFRRQLFYDTLASIDADGNWLYTEMTDSISGVIKFAQNTYLRDILRQGQKVWPMQSCFGGLALFDFDTWRATDCDYDPDRIQHVHPHQNTGTNDRSKLRVVHESYTKEEQHPRDRWSLDPRFSLAGGEACEHATFQQCLYDRSRSPGQRSLRIGIQPDLIILREPAILSRVEDFKRLLHCLGQIILYLTVAAFIALPAGRAISRFYAGRRYGKKRHVHEA